MALLGRLIERLSRPAGDIRPENLRDWVASLKNVIPIDQVVVVSVPYHIESETSTTRVPT